jgi:hypothetical protein
MRLLRYLASLACVEAPRMRGCGVAMRLLRYLAATRGVCRARSCVAPSLRCAHQVRRATLFRRIVPQALAHRVAPQLERPRVALASSRRHLPTFAARRSRLVAWAFAHLRQASCSPRRADICARKRAGTSEAQDPARVLVEFRAFERFSGTSPFSPAKCRATRSISRDEMPRSEVDLRVTKPEVPPRYLCLFAGKYPATRSISA